MGSPSAVSVRLTICGRLPEVRRDNLREMSFWLLVHFNLGKGLKIRLRVTGEYHRQERKDSANWRLKPRAFKTGTCPKFP
jgi:hypothetical protein